MNPRQLKKPPKRAFTGLVGSPLSQTTEASPPEAAAVHIPAPGPVVEAVQKRGPGRPRKHADNASKQKAYRGKKKRTEEEQERRNLIAKLIVIFDRKQDKGWQDRISNKRREELAEQARILKRNYLDGLKAASLQELRNILGAESQGDYSGKPGNEDRSKNIVATASYANVFTNLWGETTACYSSGKIGERTPSLLSRNCKPDKVERLLEDTVEALVAEAATHQTHCPFCSLDFPPVATLTGPSNSALAEHLMSMFRTGEKQKEDYSRKFHAIADYNSTVPEHLMLPLGELNTTEYHHYRVLYSLMELMEQFEKQQGKIERDRGIAQGEGIS
jgi:hypothetical protein